MNGEVWLGPNAVLGKFTVPLTGIKNGFDGEDI